MPPPSLGNSPGRGIVAEFMQMEFLAAGASRAGSALPVYAPSAIQPGAVGHAFAHFEEVIGRFSAGPRLRRFPVRRRGKHKLARRGLLPRA